LHCGRTGHLWRYCPWRTAKKVISQINVFYRMQRHTRPRMMVVHLDRLAPYVGLLGTRSLKEGAL
jgi:hypothetical protein